MCENINIYLIIKYKSKLYKCRVGYIKESKRETIF